MTTPPFRPCVVIPALNEAAAIQQVIGETRRSITPVFVVDDGSTDDTAALALAAGAQLVQHDAPRGKGAALLSGLAAARDRGFTHAVTLDADGQHRPQELTDLLALARAAPTALVIGVRDFRAPNVPRASRFGRRFSNFWVRLETGRRLGDTQSGFRVYPVALTLALGLSLSRFEFEVEVIVRAAWSGLPTRESPVSVFYAAAGLRRSHYRGVRDSARLSWLHVRLLMSRVLRLLWPKRSRRLIAGRR